MIGPPARTSWLEKSLWPALAVVAACVPFAGALSSTNVFHLRDLTMYFWPQHLWLRRTLLSGVWPSWDPYVSAGQPTDPNALNQMFLPPVLLLRLLLPPVAGFNAIVALPFPLTALGTWLFLRRRVSPTSAALGAIAFAAGGPMVSTGNFPNLSWSVAALPWLLWAIDRDVEVRSHRTFGVVALVAALQMLAGEPVTMLGSLALATAYVAMGSETRRTWSDRLRHVSRFAVSIALAGVVAIVQLAPTALASQASVRGRMAGDTYWSLHPLWLTETVLPRLFGHAFDGSQVEMPWLWPLNSGRDPFFYSLYLGSLIVILAVTGAWLGQRRWVRFWLLSIGVSLICALGEYAPVFPFLQDTLPLVRTFRFPIKFFVFAAFALAVLAAEGAEAWLAGGREARDVRAARTVLRSAALWALAIAGLVGVFLIAPFAAAKAAFYVGQLAHLADPVEGASFLFRSVPPVGIRALTVVGLGCGLAYGALAHRERRSLAVGGFLVVAAVDLLAVNAGQNPTMAASQLGPPAWAQALEAQPSERFYFGAKFEGRLAVDDADMPKAAWRSPEGASFAEARSLFMAQLAVTPAGWSARELLSFDLPKLWPVVNAEAEARFRRADRAARMRFLKRGGVRYCVLGEPPYEGAVALARVGDTFSSMAVYECVPDARRAYVVPQAVIEPSPYEAVRRLFAADFADDATVMLEHAAEPAIGTAGSPALPSALIVGDYDQLVEVEATAPAEGGYLVLLDTFDASWTVDVDGRPATLLRANGMYRAVRLLPGTHHVRFQHAHTVLRAWLPVSVAGVLVMAVALSLRPRRRDPEPASTTQAA